MARVIIHYSNDPGEPPQIYTEGDVEVISACDFAPDDRFYRMSQEAPPADIVREIEHSNIGHQGDGSEAERTAIDKFGVGSGKVH